ncbi:DEAD/DEAH box helicase [uncultured archaeon]|nr:DEAD/DEAH box helicase [uncultured archaeon]
MSSFFTESDAENATLEWFREVGYDVKNGPDIAYDGSAPERRDYRSVILYDRLKSALSRINNIDSNLWEEAVKKITTYHAPSIVENNHIFHRYLTDGITIESKDQDGRVRYDTLKLIDSKNIGNNDFLVVNQFTVAEKQERRPDVVVFINGIPIAIMELKNPANENATMEDAFNQIQTYKNDIPTIFHYNEIVVISDGIDAKIGAITSDWQRFMPWRSVQGKSNVPVGKPDLNTVVHDVFSKDRILDIIVNFILFEVDKSNISKKIAGYHQYNAVNATVNNTLNAISENGDRKIGVVWHTQGSGKSITMIFYAGKIIQHPALENPTIVVMTDRNDLDNQLFDGFSRCHEVLRQTPVQAETRKNLRELLKVASGGIIFTTIQKFVPDTDDMDPLLTGRRNVIVIADEAHRSQYDFIDGFARHLHDALPNASFIGFTATPLELSDRTTVQIFGDYIDIYDIERSVEDKFTVPIYYEARLVKLHVKRDELDSINKEIDEITEGEGEQVQDRLKSKWSRLEAIVGTQSRIDEIASDIVRHFEARESALVGKALVVCTSRRICVEMYDAITRIKPEWHSDQDDTGAIKVIMTGSASDPQKMQPHIRNKARREHIASRLKRPNDPLEIVIVRDMWLTGFDAPILHTMYVDKIMQGHNLMQAIARVNRVFKDKQGGLIVDYIGIGYNLKSALISYSPSDRRDVGIDQEEAVKVMLEKLEVCRDIFHGFDYSIYFRSGSSQRMTIIVNALNFILGVDQGKERFVKAVTELSRAFSLAVPMREALEVRDEVGFLQAIKAQIVKHTVSTERSREETDTAIRQIISEAIGSRGIIDIFEAAGIKKPDVSPIMSDEFLNSIKSMRQRNLALELLEKLINDELRTHMRKNLVQSRLFSDMLKDAIKRYENHTVEAAQVIEELIGLAREVKASADRGSDLKMTEEELAFYDALEVNDSAVKVLGDETLREIALELVDTVKKNKTIDWTVRENVRAKLRAAVKRILRKYGYPPDKQKKATETVIKQAELIAKGE